MCKFVPDWLKRGLDKGLRFVGWCWEQGVAFVQRTVERVVRALDVQPAAAAATPTPAPQIQLRVTSNAPVAPAAVRASAPSPTPAVAPVVVHRSAAPVAPAAPVASPPPVCFAPEASHEEPIEKNEQAAPEPGKPTIGQLLLLLAALAALHYVNSTPWALAVIELLRAADVFEIALDAAKYLVDILCRKWPPLARMRDWMKNVADTPVGKAIGKEASTAVKRWFVGALEWARKHVVNWLVKLAGGGSMPTPATS